MIASLFWSTLDNHVKVWVGRCKVNRKIIAMARVAIVCVAMGLGLWIHCSRLEELPKVGDIVMWDVERQAEWAASSCRWISICESEPGAWVDPCAGRNVHCHGDPPKPYRSFDSCPRSTQQVANLAWMALHLQSDLAKEQLRHFLTNVQNERTRGFVLTPQCSSHFSSKEWSSTPIDERDILW